MMKRALIAVLLASLLPACHKGNGNAVTAPSGSASPNPPTLAPPTSTPPANQPPTLALKINPRPPSGPAPRDVNVNMCQSTDPDGDRLVFEYKWGGTGREHFTFRCRDDHTYAVPGTYKAFFCVNDNNDHRDCHNELIVIG